ncbi:cytochrome b5 domain containing 2 [Phyllostomus discolor]|uniref:Neuferricin n=1 Tax=Phyllostomus discolor TaxID=89673 RepID=A0A833ZG56_9CHIR|nr:cytochrome b5 domain containing 2 [Phyllostomus discolor]
MLRLGGRGLLLGLAAAAAAVVAARLMGWWRPRAGFRLLIPEELARYRGGPGDPGLYLALLGRVYDVSSGRRHYEPGAHYSGFAGRDASRAFVTGDYSEAGLVDDVSDLPFSEMLTLQNWLSFYEKNYEFVGKVIGRFYGEDGLPTPELTQVEAKISKGLEAKTRALEEKHKFPPCNSEWSSARGSRFWCSPNSSCPLPRLPANSPHLPKNKSLSQAACQLETSSLQKTSVVSCNRLVHYLLHTERNHTGNDLTKSLRHL